MKIAVVGDLHLDAVTHGVDRFDEVRAALVHIAEHAVAHSFGAVAFLGDLCDPGTYRSHRAEAALVRVCGALSAAGVVSYAITGNHDVLDDGTGGHTLLSLAASGHARVYSEPVVLRLWSRGVQLVLLPFAPASHGYDPAEFARENATDELVLVLGHLNHAGARGGSESASMARGRDVYWPVEAIREHLPNAVCVGGHYHAHHETEDVYFPGALARLRFDEEANVPGWLEVDTDRLGEGFGAFTWHELPGARRMFTAELEPIYEFELEAVRGAIVRLRLFAGMSAADEARAFERFYAAGAEKVFVASRARGDQPGEPAAAGIGGSDPVAAPARSLRRVALDRLERTPGLEHRELSRELLSAALDRSGA